MRSYEVIQIVSMTSALSLAVLAVEAGAIYGVSWLLWRTLRQYVAQSRLDNIPGPPSASIWKGNLRQIFDLDGWDFHSHIARTYGSVVKIHGLFGDKQLFVSDPKALHYIIVKEQDIYEETSLFIESNRLLFGVGLLSSLGDPHKRQRKMLNPVFSIAHMREMLPIFYNIGNKLRDTLADRCARGPREIDMLKWISRTALELIARSGLGHSFDPLEDDEIPHPYIKVMKKLTPTLIDLAIAQNFLPWIVKIGTPSLRHWLAGVIPWAPLNEARDMADFMHKTSIEIWKNKIKAMEEGDEAVLRQVGQGKDIMSILMRANMAATDEDKLPEEELIGQISTLTQTAVDTTSSALSRVLHLLALHPEVQAKLREEIGEAKAKVGGELDYDSLVALPYLDAVCRETLRLYAPVTIMSRTARKETVLPLQDPIRGNDGTMLKEIHVPRETDIIIGIRASNTNPALWGEDAAEWKPERWLTPLPESISQARVPGIYSNLMTFLGGGRACIGFKFSQLEMKVILSILVEAFVFEPSSKDIVWLMTGIVSPNVKGSSDAMPKLPLTVKLTK